MEPLINISQAKASKKRIRCHTELLSVDADGKTPKGQAMGYLTGILYLSPANEADAKITLCPGATKECVAACLHNQGRIKLFKKIRAARIRKTREYLNDFEGFVKRLAKDVERLKKCAAKHNLIPVVRINGTSDQPKLAMRLAAMFPEVQFYDYTKLNRPWERIRENYALTYSYSGENLAQSLEALRHGVNVAVVFDAKPFPATWHGYRVIDGDESDLRFLDAKGVIVGLKAKGDSASKVNPGGFIQIANAQPKQALPMAA